MQPFPTKRHPGKEWFRIQGQDVSLLNPQPSGPQTVLSLNKSFTSLASVFISTLRKLLFCGWILWDLWWQLPFSIIHKLLVNYEGEAGYLNFKCSCMSHWLHWKLTSLTSSISHGFIFHKKKIVRSGVMFPPIRHSVLLSFTMKVGIARLVILWSRPTMCVATYNGIPMRPASRVQPVPTMGRVCSCFCLEWESSLSLLMSLLSSLSNCEITADYLLGYK